MLNGLFLLIKKNLRLLLRAKASALIVVFAPLLLILLIGLSYNTSAHYGLNIGVFSDNFEGDTAILIDSLQDKDFKVITYYDLGECKEDIKYDFVHACVELPSNFEVIDNSPTEVTFHIDQSRINLVWIVQKALEKEFNLKSQKLSEQLVSDIFTNIVETQGKIDTEIEKIDNIASSNEGISSSSSSLSDLLNELELNVIDESVEWDVFDEFQRYILGRMNSGVENLEDISSEVNSVNNITTNEVEEIEDIISSTRTNLQNAIALVAGESDYSFSHLKTIVQGLEAELINANNNILTVSDKLSSLNSHADSVTDNVDTISSSLNDLKGNLDSLNKQLGDLQVSDSGTITTPLITKIEKISIEKTQLNYVFPSLLALIVMFLSIMLGNTLVMMEKNTPAYLRNFLIPVKKVTFVLATVLSNLIILSIQLLVILLISLLFIPDSLAILPFLFLILIISATCFTLVGMMIGYIFSSEETGILASISTGSLFLFLSGVILPVEGMSVGLRELTMLNPFVITEKLIREVFLFNSAFVVILEDLVMLLLYALILFMLILVLDALTSRNLLGSLLYKKHKHRRSGLIKKRRQKEKKLADPEFRSKLEGRKVAKKNKLNFLSFFKKKKVKKEE